MGAAFNVEFASSFIHTLQRTASKNVYKILLTFFKQGHLVASIDNKQN
jgi:hypothetical protein